MCICQISKLAWSSIKNELSLFNFIVNVPIDAVFYDDLQRISFFIAVIANKHIHG
jgi:hypothetical protein